MALWMRASRGKILLRYKNVAINVASSYNYILVSCHRCMKYRGVVLRLQLAHHVVTEC